MKQRNRRIPGVILSVGFLSAIFWNQPIYRRYRLKGKGHLKRMKIVMISDLHNTIYGRNQSKLLNMIKKEGPDLVLACGDMSDERTDMSGSIMLFEGLQEMCPIYFVSGNHEHWMNDSDQVFEVFDHIGVVRIENSAVEVMIDGEKLTLIGVNDPDYTLHSSAKASLTASIDQAFEAVSEEDGYRILMSHRPEHIDLYSQYDIDLVLSGHAHGGQVRVPGILNGLYAPNQGFLPKYAGGYYKMNQELDFIVSRGLSLKRSLPRIMNPPEVIVIEFE